MRVSRLTHRWHGGPALGEGAVVVVAVVVTAVVVGVMATRGLGSLAVCAAPDTPIATPSGDRAIASLRKGDRPIASLRKGDLVWSVDRGRIVAVPIATVGQTPVDTAHVMVRAKFANSTVLRISPGHPTADGRTFGDLHKGDRLDHAEITEAMLVTYGEPFTHDILPASDTGAYFAGGVLIGSTLWRRGQSVAATASP